MDLLSVEQKIALLFQKGENLVEMTCVIDNVRDDRLELSLPQYFMRYIDCLQVGARLTAKAFSKLGTIDFNTVVITSPLEDIFSIEVDANAVKLTPGKELPVVNAIESIDITSNKGQMSTKTIELSTEYVKITSNIKLDVDDKLDCILQLPKDYGTIKFRAIVADVDDVFDDEYKIKFLTITESSLQDLLYYMYMYSKETI